MLYNICRSLKGDLNKALVLASIFHDGIKDKGDNNYILHPLQVMNNLKIKEEKYQVVAILHDILEDTEISIEDLRNVGFSEEIIDALSCLSRKKNETYRQFIERISKNKIAIYVKLADLENNIDISRIKTPIKEDFERIKKYKKYYILLLNIINNEKL